MKRIILFTIVVLFLLQVVSAAEPTYTSGVDTMVWNDSFDRYTTLLSMTADGSCPPAAQDTYGTRTMPNVQDGCAPNTTRYQLTNDTRTGTGKALHGIIFDDPGHVQQSTTWLSPWCSSLPCVSPPNISQTQVYQFWFRISPGGTPGTAGTKWFEWWTNASAGSDRTQIGPSQGNTTRPLFYMEPALSGGVDRAEQPVGPWWDEINDGEWHRWTVMYKPNTAYDYPNPSSRDGIIRAWIDGSKIIDISQTAANVIPPGGTKVWSTQADVDSIPDVTTQFLKWPDVFNGADVGFNLSHDDLLWWIENGEGNAADLNTDDKVDFSDILIIIQRILGLNSNSAADMNNDGNVNIFDLVNASRLFGKQYGEDSVAPRITSSKPTNNTNLSAGTTQIILFAETNERATCRYLNTTGGSFATMNNFTRSGRVSHSITLTGLQDGTTYNYYIQCQDETGNLNSTDYVVSFGVNSNAGVLFSSDWSNSTGVNSPTAVRDGIKWDGECCDANVNNGVVTAASLGITDWPTANLYYVGSESGQAAIRTHQVWKDSLGNVGSGTQRYYRYYARVPYGDTHGAATTGNSEHGVESGQSSSSLSDSFAFFRVPRNDGTWFPGWTAYITNWRWVADNLNLNKSKTYRLEWHVNFTSTSAYNVEIRIYNSSNSLIADESDFHLRAPADNATTLEGFIHPWNSATDTAFWDLITMGTNGPSSNFPLANLIDEDLFYHGAVCIRNDTWCGPYSGGI